MKYENPQEIEYIGDQGKTRIKGSPPEATGKSRVNKPPEPGRVPIRHPYIASRPHRPFPVGEKDWARGDGKETYKKGTTFTPEPVFSFWG